MNKNFLEWIPIRSPKYRWQTDEKEQVTIFVENKGLANKAAQVFFRKPKVSQVHLDETGSAVWQGIDGSRTAGELAEEAGTTYGQVAVYLMLLKRQKYIEFVNSK